MKHAILLFLVHFPCFYPPIVSKALPTDIKQRNEPKMKHSDSGAVKVMAKHPHICNLLPGSKSSDLIYVTLHSAQLLSVTMTKTDSLSSRFVGLDSSSSSGLRSKPGTDPTPDSIHGLLVFLEGRVRSVFRSSLKYSSCGSLHPSLQTCPTPHL